MVLEGNWCCFPAFSLWLLGSWSMAGRAQNWTVGEKEYLFELVSTQINIIEDKKSDTNAHKKKRVAWKVIYDKFVVRYGGTGRDIARLKEQWKRIKSTAKKEVSDYERAQKRTGGGKAPIPPSGLSEQIKALLKHEFETLSNPFDDDFIEANTAEPDKDMTTIEDYNLMNDTDETYVYDIEGESAGPSREHTRAISRKRHCCS